MRKIITDINELATACSPLEFITDKTVDKSEGNKIIQELKEVMKADKNIIALSAPQIGYKKRIFCIRFSDVIKTFINPIITKKSGSVISPETCASMPGKEILIARPEEITVVYYTDEYKYEDNKLLGDAAKIFDQQSQLLDGIIPSELGLVSDVEKDGSLSDLTEEEVKEVTEIYKKFIETKSKKMTEEIEKASDETKEQFKKLKFTEDVINGRTLVINKEPKKNREQRRAEKFSKKGR